MPFVLEANSWGAWPNWQQWGWNWSTAGGMVPPGGVPPPNQALVPGKSTTSSGSMGVPPYGFPQNSQAYSSGTGVYDYNHAAGSEPYTQVSHVTSVCLIFVCPDQCLGRKRSERYNPTEYVYFPNVFVSTSCN